MFYVMELEVAEDEDGEEVDYFRFELERPEDADFPWYRGISFEDAPAAPIPLIVDLSNESAELAADYLIEPIPLVTRRLRVALEAAGVSNLQWFATDVSNRQEWRNGAEYFAMNVVGLVSAADPSKSDFARPLGVMGADEISRFVVDGRKCVGLKVFRLAEHLSTLVVSEEVRDVLLAYHVNTLNFVPLDGWVS